MLELNFHANSFETHMNEWEDFKRLRMENNDLRNFYNDWNTFIAISNIAYPETLLHLQFFKQIRDHLDICFEMFVYERLPDCNPNKTYAWLHDFVGVIIDVLFFILFCSSA